jgi:hypothetical protein
MRTFTIFGLLLVLIVTPTIAFAQSPLPKEGNGATTSYFTGTSKTLAMGKDSVRITYEVLGIVTNDAGQGFAHNVSVRCQGALDVVKGTWDSEQASCVWADRDGDQVFYRFTGSGSGAQAKLTGSYVGGTGKYEGITGHFESMRTSLRPTMERTNHSVSKNTYAYRIP